MSAPSGSAALNVTTFWESSFVVCAAIGSIVGGSLRGVTVILKVAGVVVMPSAAVTVMLAIPLTVGTRVAFSEQLVPVPVT